MIALKQMEHEKLVVAIPRRGVYVRKFSLKDLIQYFEVRRFLESEAAKKASKLIKDDQIIELRKPGLT